MASPRALKIKREEALDRIEAWIRPRVDGGEKLTPLPRIHRDADMLHTQQITTIADWLERVEVDATLQQARDLIATGRYTKAELEAVINGTDIGTD